MKVESPKGSVVVAVQPDAGVPRGAAAMVVNQPGVEVTRLVDATAPYTDVRVERA